jgi:hypothetical protein
MAVPTHRFTLSGPMDGLLNGLSREGFHAMLRSEADARWSRFVEENTDTIDRERTRLEALGYQGDLGTKMFRSVRYYRGRGQQAEGVDTSEREETSGQRREYVATPGQLLSLMDEHVEKHCFGEKPMSPAAGWAHFEQEYSQAVTLAVQGLTGSDKLTQPDAQAKVKKAYKNRQYLKRRQRQAVAHRAMTLAQLQDDD